MTHETHLGTVESSQRNAAILGLHMCVRTCACVCVCVCVSACVCVSTDIGRHNLTSGKYGTIFWQGKLAICTSRITHTAFFAYLLYIVIVCQGTRSI